MKRAKIALAFQRVSPLFYRLCGQRVARRPTVTRNLRFQRVQPVKLLFGPNEIQQRNAQFVIV